MKSSFHKAVLGGAALLALSAVPALWASASWAAEAPAQTDGPGMRHGDGPRFGHDPARMADHLRAVLQLTPAQEPALQAFLTAMHRPHEGPDGMAGPDRGPPPGDPAARKAEMKARHEEMEKKHAEEAALSTPQRLDLMVKRMEEHETRRKTEVEAHVAAVKQFYAALTPTQQKAFDALHGGMMGGRGHDGMHGRPPMHPMGMMGMEPPMPPLAMGPPPPPQE